MKVCVCVCVCVFVLGGVCGFVCFCVLRLVGWWNSGVVCFVCGRFCSSVSLCDSCLLWLHCLFVSVFVCLFFRLLVSLFVRLSVCLFVFFVCSFVFASKLHGSVAYFAG